MPRNTHTHTHTHSYLPAAMVEEQISPLKDFLITYIMPEKCYEHLFLRLNLKHAPLLQIWVVVQDSSAQGLSLVSVVLQLLAVSVHTAACILHKFPIGAYGDSVFVLVQFVLLVFLIQYYRGKTVTGCVLLSVYSGVMYLLTSAVTPEVVVMAMQEWSVVFVISGQLIQAGCNLTSGSTGQLSGASVFLVFLASLGRTFRSTQGFLSLLSSCCSLLLFIQTLIYRKTTTRETTRRKKEE
ncbi:mannose-P-dolichol utilization defect 1a isoform X3 [Hemibagrus wyckioides]|uniref:mannose-P-dolichol utilization defect 1a isoform X3 n=1 Tax=Hemibagrus wyckioides TaxID=337641 RepID=UPI00266C4365|nr:mannose-P-dolichol utilization defect 1a isoform X3 [Hemibagrus wyckioides]